MVDRRDIGSWLAGPQLERVDARDGEMRHRGERLGLPEEGPGSLAGTGRRVVALLVDWMLCQLIAMAFLGYTLGSNTGLTTFTPLLVFVVENILMVATLGHTIGHRLLGMRVVALGRGYVGPGRAVLRTLLLALVIPAVVWDADGRGLHDKAAGTVLVRI